MRAAGTLKSSSAPVRSAVRSSAAEDLLAAGYPTPKYLPNGYRLVRVVANAPDGLRAADGRQLPEQLHMLAFRSEGRQDVHHPLTVVVSRSAEPARMFAAVDAKSVQKPVRLNTGAVTQATYCDGQWLSGRTPSERMWSTDTNHSVVLRRDGFVVGVRGSRAVGVSHDELLRIAASVA